jgi:hypothetical protein
MPTGRESPTRLRRKHPLAADRAIRAMANGERGPSVQICPVRSLDTTGQSFGNANVGNLRRANLRRIGHVAIH